MHQVPDIGFFFGNLAGLSIWLQLILGLFLRSSLGDDDQALNELFAFGPLGSLSFRRPYLMRTKFFLPWVTARTIQSCPSRIRNLAWATRLSGTVFLVCALGMAGSFAYAVLYGA